MSAFLFFGNTHTQHGRILGGKLHVSKSVKTTSLLSTLASGDFPFSLKSRFYASVVPLTPKVQVTLEHGGCSRLATTEAPWRFSNGTREPEQVGIDRLLAIQGALVRNRSLPSVDKIHVLDTGTFWTLNTATRTPQSHTGEKGWLFQGGMILPSPHQYLEMIAQKNARLTTDPNVEPFSKDLSPPSLIGDSTHHALEAGAKCLYQLGFLPWVQTLSSQENARLFVTGGNSHFFESLSPEAVFCPHLVLEGMADLYDA